LRKVKLLIVALMLLLLSAIPAAMADQVDVYENQKLVKSVVFKIGVPYYVVDGKTPGVKMDVAPFIHNDRTFVPVRFLGNALGVDDSNIFWDNGTQTATLKGAKAVLSMTIGKSEVVSNGAAKAIDVAPMLVDPGRTMLPARYVADGLGYEVDWDEATQTVICWPAGEPKPDVSAAVDWLNQVQEQQEPEQSTQTATQLPYGGYSIPAKTDLTFGYDFTYPKGQIDFLIQLKKGDLERQYADARSILSQAVDQETVEKAIDYAKKVQYAAENGSRENPIYCPITTFNAPNGMAVRVGGGGGYTVEFQVWHTN